ncbi:lytic transglycosylase domain-containing protein [Jutongia sp.]
MVDHIVRLDIKPLMTYNDGKKRKTTLTSFEKVLEHKEAGIATEEDTKASAKADRRKTKGSTDSKAGQAVETNPAKTLYADPVTGRAVTYEDVADAKKSQADKTSGTRSVSAQSKTTTADSMKTTRYDSYFKKAAAKYGVSESLLKAIAKAESNFNAKSVSSAGAMGVMQLMPDTAKGLGVTDPYDPEQNIMGGAKCISQKLKEFNGDERMALAAYNAGSGAVRRYGGIPSYCKSYVNKVQSYKKAYETADAI